MNQADLDNFLWRSLEGGLGAEKVAWLREAPLSEIVGTNLGVPDFNVGDAIAHVAKTAHEKKANHRKQMSSFRALGELIGNPPAEPQHSFARKVASAQKLRDLAGLAMRPDEHVKVASARKVVDDQIFDEMLKLAANPLAGVAQSSFARNMAKGLALGTGATIPLYVGGNALSDDVSTDFRDKALQTAAGIGGIATLGYGANRMMQNAAYKDRHPDKFKTAAFMADPVGDRVVDLTASVYIDQFLAQVDQTEKVAEIRELNRDFGVTVLCELERLTS